MSARGPMSFAQERMGAGRKGGVREVRRLCAARGAADWLAGGKRMIVDRIEWVVMPDPATASAALQNGEVDWWENPISDLVPRAEEEPQHRASTSPIRSATSARSA